MKGDHRFEVGQDPRSLRTCSHCGRWRSRRLQWARSTRGKRRALHPIGARPMWPCVARRPMRKNGGPGDPRHQHSICIRHFMLTIACTCQGSVASKIIVDHPPPVKVPKEAHRSVPRPTLDRTTFRKLLTSPDDEGLRPPFSLASGGERSAGRPYCSSISFFT